MPREITEPIMPDIKDDFSRHAHFVEQYKNSNVNKFEAFLRRVARGLRGELLKTNTVTSQSRIEAKLKFVEELITTEFTAYTDEIVEQIELFAVSEAGFVAETVKNASGVSFTLPSDAQLIAAVNARPFNTKLLRDYLKDFTSQQAKAVSNAVSMGFYEGKTTPEIVRDIIGTKAQNFKNGTLHTSRTSAETMVRTALSHTSAVARNKTYEDNDDLIPYYEWVSTLDGATSPICRKRDGMVWRVNKGPLPPAHFNCRSSTAPMFKEDVTKVKVSKENPTGLIKKPQGGTRASMDGQVSADLTYNDWLKRQTKAFQVDVLGKQKAELFRKGGLTMDQFVNNKGQELTLDQLQAKYPTAWGKI